MARKAQVILKHGTTHLVCWVDDVVKPGNLITLKNTDAPDLLWEVIRISETRKEPDEFNRGWNNNI